MYREINRAAGVASLHFMTAYQLIFCAAVTGFALSLFTGFWSHEVAIMSFAGVVGFCGVFCEINQFAAKHLRKIASVVRQLKEHLSALLKSTLSKIIVVLPSVRQFDRLMEIPLLVAKPAPSVLLSFRS